MPDEFYLLWYTFIQYCMPSNTVSVYLQAPSLSPSPIRGLCCMPNISVRFTSCPGHMYDLRALLITHTAVSTPSGGRCLLPRRAAGCRASSEENARGARRSVCSVLDPTVKQRASWLVLCTDVQKTDSTAGKVVPLGGLFSSGQHGGQSHQSRVHLSGATHLSYMQ